MVISSIFRNDGFVDAGAVVARRCHERTFRKPKPEGKYRQGERPCHEHSFPPIEIRQTAEEHQETTLSIIFPSEPQQ